MLSSTTSDCNDTPTHGPRESEKKQRRDRSRTQEYVGSQFVATASTVRRTKSIMNQYNGERNHGRDVSQWEWQREYTTQGDSQNYNQQNNNYTRPANHSCSQNYTNQIPKNYFPRNCASNHGSQYNACRGKGGYWRSYKQDYSNSNRFYENAPQSYSQPRPSNWRANSRRAGTGYRGRKMTYSETRMEDSYTSTNRRCHGPNYPPIELDRNTPFEKPLWTRREHPRYSLEQRHGNVKRKEARASDTTSPINVDSCILPLGGNNVRSAESHPDLHEYQVTQKTIHTTGRQDNVDALVVPTLDSHSHEYTGKNVSVSHRISPSDDESRNTSQLPTSTCISKHAAGEIRHVKKKNTSTGTIVNEEDDNNNAQKATDLMDLKTRIIKSKPSIVGGSDIEVQDKIKNGKEVVVKIKERAIDISKSTVSLNQTDEDKGTLASSQRKTSPKSTIEKNATIGPLLKEKSSYSAHKPSQTSEKSEDHSKKMPITGKKSLNQIHSENNSIKSSPNKITQKRSSQEHEIPALSKKKPRINSRSPVSLQEGTVDLLKTLQKRKGSIQSDKSNSQGAAEKTCHDLPSGKTRVANKNTCERSHSPEHTQNTITSRNPNQNSKKTSSEKKQRNQTKKAKAKDKRSGNVHTNAEVALNCVVKPSSSNLQKSARKRKESASGDTKVKKRKTSISTKPPDNVNKTLKVSNLHISSSSNTTAGEDMANDSSKSPKRKDRVTVLQINDIIVVSDNEPCEKTRSRNKHAVQKKEDSIESKVQNSILISDDSKECKSPTIQDKMKERGVAKHEDDLSKRANIVESTFISKPTIVTCEATTIVSGEPTPHSQVSQSSLSDSDVESNRTKETFPCQTECNGLNSRKSSEHYSKPSKTSINVILSDKNLTEVTSTSESIPLMATNHIIMVTKEKTLECSYKTTPTVLTGATEECIPNKRQKGTDVHSSLSQSAGFTTLLHNEVSSVSLSYQLKIGSGNPHSNVSDEEKREVLETFVQNETRVDSGDLKHSSPGESSSKTIEESYYITYGDFKRQNNSYKGIGMNNIAHNSKGKSKPKCSNLVDAHSSNVVGNDKTKKNQTFSISTAGTLIESEISVEQRDTIIESHEQNAITEHLPFNNGTICSSEKKSACKQNTTHVFTDVPGDTTSDVFTAKKTIGDSHNSEPVDVNLNEQLSWRVLTIDIPPLAFSWKTLVCKLRNLRTLACKRESIEIQNDTQECTLQQVSTTLEGDNNIATCTKAKNADVHRGSQDAKKSTNANSMGVNMKSIENESRQMSNKCMPKKKTEVHQIKPINDLNIRQSDTEDADNQCLHDIDEFLDILDHSHSHQVLQDPAGNRDEHRDCIQQMNIGCTDTLRRVEHAEDNNESSYTNEIIQNVNLLCDQRVILPCERKSSNLGNGNSQLLVQTGNTTGGYNEGTHTPNENVLRKESAMGVDPSRRHQERIDTQYTILAENEVKSELNNNSSLSNDEGAISQCGLLATSPHISLPNLVGTVPNCCTEASEIRTFHVSRPLEAAFTPQDIFRNTVIDADVEVNTVSKEKDTNNTLESDETTTVDHSFSPSESVSATHKIQSMQHETHTLKDIGASNIAKDMQNSLSEDLETVLEYDSPMSPVEMNESTDFIPSDGHSLYDIDVECKLEKLAEGLYVITRIAELMPGRDPAPLINLMKPVLQDLIDELTGILWFHELYTKIIVMSKSPSFENRSLDMNNLKQLLLTINTKTTTNTTFHHNCNPFTGPKLTYYLSEQCRHVFHDSTMSVHGQHSLLTESSQSYPPPTESKLLAIDIESKLENSAEQLFNITTTMEFLPASDPTCIISLMLPTLRQAMEELSHSLLLREVHKKINFLSLGRNKPQLGIMVVHQLLVMNSKNYLVFNQPPNEEPAQGSNQPSGDKQNEFGQVKAQSSMCESINGDALSRPIAPSSKTSLVVRNDLMIHSGKTSDKQPNTVDTCQQSFRSMGQPQIKSVLNNDFVQCAQNLNEHSLKDKEKGADAKSTVDPRANVLLLMPATTCQVDKTTQHDTQRTVTTNTANAVANSSANTTEKNVKEFLQHGKYFEQPLPTHLPFIRNIDVLERHVNVESTDNSLQVCKQREESSLNHSTLAPPELQSRSASTAVRTLPHTILTDTINSEEVTANNADSGNNFLANKELHTTSGRHIEETSLDAAPAHLSQSTEEPSQKITSHHQSASERPVICSPVLQIGNLPKSSNNDQSTMIDTGSAEKSLATRELAYTPCVVCGKKSTIQSKQKIATYCCLEHYKYDWYSQRNSNPP